MTATQVTVDFFRGVADALQRLETEPHGPVGDPQTQRLAGQAAVRLCGGDANRARTLWKVIAQEVGYTPQALPHAVCVALIRASSTDNLVPDVEAPEPS